MKVIKLLKNNYVLAIVSGLLLSLGWPTYGFPILLFFAFVPLLIAERNIREQSSKRKGIKVFIAAYLCFVIWNAITTWWLWYSSAVGMYFAVLVNALLMALVFLIFHIVARKLPQKIHLLFLAAIWIAFEKFHLNWDFSWPWLNLGNAFSKYQGWIQWYEYTGTFGGSLWVWILNIGLFKTYLNFKEKQQNKRLSVQLAKQVLYIAIPICISYLIYFNYREAEETLEIVLLQPNIDPYTEKFEQKNDQIATNLVQMAQTEVSGTTDFVIAPETVLAVLRPINRFEISPEKLKLRELIGNYSNLNILTGADFFRFYEGSDRPTPSANRTSKGDWYDAYNSAVLINNNKTSQYYFKSKLVVGVERFPFRNILEPLLGDIMLDLGGTISSRGTQKERQVFSSFDKKFFAAPVICYESIYGEFVTGYIKNEANFLAIITNDAWWRKTQGHKQHLSYAKLRAIETRRSIARSANTGISAFINQRGDIINKTLYGEKIALKGTLAVNTKKTFYVKYGDFIARIAALLSALLFLYAFTVRRRSLTSVKKNRT